MKRSKNQILPQGSETQNEFMSWRVPCHLTDLVHLTKLMYHTASCTLGPIHNLQAQRGCQFAGSHATPVVFGEWSHQPHEFCISFEKQQYERENLQHHLLVQCIFRTWPAWDELATESDHCWTAIPLLGDNLIGKDQPPGKWEMQSDHLVKLTKISLNSYNPICSVYFEKNTHPLPWQHHLRKTIPSFVRKGKAFSKILPTTYCFSKYLY